MFDKFFRKTPEPSVDVVPAAHTRFEMEIAQKNREHDYWLERKARQREVARIEERKLNIKPGVLGEDILQQLKKIKGN
jgi:hypothetical protein